MSFDADETHELAVVGSDLSQTANLVVSPPDPDVKYEVRCALTLVVGGLTLSGSGSDYRDALDLIRAQLENRELQLCCMGCHRAVTHSGMSLQMSNGRKAYLLPGNRHPSRSDLVSIFDPADPEDCVTIEAQRIYVANTHAEVARITS